MQIRNIDKSFLPRLRASEKDTVRKTARELGAFLDKLSEAVKQSHKRFADNDSVDDDTLKKSQRYTRGFKLPPASADDAHIETELSDEQKEALELLKEARSLAADASARSMQYDIRDRTTERFNAIFREVGEKRIGTLLSLSPALREPGPLFSLATAESARSAYLGVEDIIVKVFEIGAQGESGEAGANPEYETALGASERLRDFLMDEGPAAAFGRFREINRSNVLALLK